MIEAREWIVKNVLKENDAYLKNRIKFPDWIDSLSPTGVVTCAGFFMCVFSTYFLKCLEKQAAFLMFYKKADQIK
jgi:hypothetical protein